MFTRVHGSEREHYTMETRNLIGYQYTKGGKSFRGVNPANGGELEPEFNAASLP
jgi:alpha-ketoglutaric semialdehyde dehydrogenase